MAFDIFLFALLCLSTGKPQRLFTIINQLTTTSVRKIRDARRGLVPTGQDSTAEQWRPEACLQPCSLPPRGTGISRVSDSGFLSHKTRQSTPQWIVLCCGYGGLCAKGHCRLSHTDAPAQHRTHFLL